MSLTLMTHQFITTFIFFQSSVIPKLVLSSCVRKVMKKSGKGMKPRLYLCYVKPCSSMYVEAYSKWWGHASTFASVQKPGGSGACSARETFKTRCSKVNLCLDARKNTRSWCSSSCDDFANKDAWKWLSIISGPDYWNGILEWPICTKIILIHCNKVCLAVELHPALYKFSNMTFCQPCLSRLFVVILKCIFAACAILKWVDGLELLLGLLRQWHIKLVKTSLGLINSSPSAWEDWWYSMLVDIIVKCASLDRLHHSQGFLELEQRYVLFYCLCWSLWHRLSPLSFNISEETV